MASLKKTLLKKGYTPIKLNTTKTNHFEITAKLNGVKGSFIVDTGASNTCIGFDHKSHFNLEGEAHDVKAAGAGATDMETEVSKKNKIKIGDWKLKKTAIIIFDLSHVNDALTQHKSTPVHGIIGADILKTGKAIIDYEKSMLYLK